MIAGLKHVPGLSHVAETRNLSSPGQPRYVLMLGAHNTQPLVEGGDET